MKQLSASHSLALSLRHSAFAALHASLAALLVVLGGCGAPDGGPSGSHANLRLTGTESPSDSRAMHDAWKFRPFHAASQYSEDAVLAQLPADQLGIDFVHAWDPPARFADRINSYAIGVGTAIGDIDGDHLPDVYFACQSKGGQLYKNLGDWKFANVTKVSGLDLDGFWGTGVTMADIDNDGDLDLYLCAFGQPNRLYINDGAGAFREKASEFGLAFEGASVAGVFADYDNDGLLDMYLLTNHFPLLEQVRMPVERNFDGTPRLPRKYEQYRYIMNPPRGVAKPRVVEGAQYDKLYQNRGDRGFVDVTKKSGIGEFNYHGLSATWFDYDHDGDQDLYVANDFFGPDHLYRNNGDGSFRDVVKQTMPYIPWFSMGADAADVNNDGFIDLFAADMSSTSHYRAKVTMGDMSADAWFLDYANPQQYMRNMMYVNAGTGRFMESAYLSGIDSTDWTWSVKFGDLDGDRAVDLFVTNGMTRDFQNSDLKNESLELQKKNRVPTPSSFWEKLPMLKEPNMTFRNLGNLKFEDVSSEWGVQERGVSLGAAFGDLDGDGDLDVVVNNFANAPTIYRNDLAPRANHVQLELVGAESNRGGIGAEIRLAAGGTTQLRQVIASRGYMSSDQPMVHFGLGDAEVVDEIEIRWPSGAVQSAKNLRSGGRYVVTERPGSASYPRDHTSRRTPLFAKSDAAAEVVHYEVRFDDFALQPLLPNRLSQLGPDLASGDVDGDGVDELVLGGAAGYPAQLFKLTDGKFKAVSTSAFEADAASEDLGILLFDADGDDDIDLYVASGGVEHDLDDDAYQDRLYLNDVDGKLRKAADGVLPQWHASTACVVAADFDRDGDDDLFVGGRVTPGQYPVSPSSRLLRNESNSRRVKFVDATSTAAADVAETGMVTSAVWSDVNGDEWPDLLVTHEWGPVKIFENEQGRLVDKTTEYQLAERLGWWTAIAAGDFDEDGDPDFIVTNFGSNTKYHVSPDHPALIYYSDFEGNGNFQIVEAKLGGKHELLPVRGRSCSSNAIPIVAERFPTYHEFAMATLPEIYTPQCLQDALQLEANELRSGLLINRDGRALEFKPLPLLAQLAPGRDVAVADFNGDGRLDAYLAQNFFGPQRETGRMAGGLGLVLLSNGKGEFEALWPYESGVEIAHDATSVALTDFSGDGRLDLVVAINDGVAVAYEMQSETQPIATSQR